MNIGLIGLGTVGGSTAQVLLKKSASLRRSAGGNLKLLYACDQRHALAKQLGIPAKQYVNDAQKVLNDPQVDVVVELIGGMHPAKEFVLQALKNGKHVVTANKALLAEHGTELLKAASRANKRLLFEAAVGGGIPIVEGLGQGLAANQLSALYAIINGTCNYVLTLMEEQGSTMQDALALAQKKGFAEANPALDIDGIDSAHKLSLMCLVGFGRQAKMKEMHIEGISKLSPVDMELAQSLGYGIKLLAIAKRVGEELEARVHPTLLPLDHPLVSVRGVYNAVFVQGDLVGNQLFYGKGAGGNPTASAVVSDILQLARAPQALPPNPIDLSDGSIQRIRKMADVRSRYYMRFSVTDRPGVLAQIARHLGSQEISISSVIQPERTSSRAVPVVIMTHEAAERQVQTALKRINALEAVKRGTVLLRVEEG
ncbi:MAG: homoserine dehydrogenase [Candidatus Omnitrophica bacterium]|nr:homoserine dehydrogenase [Candidatus Omnitrophota bacterium]